MDAAILNVETTNLGEVSGGEAAVSEELGHDGELLGGVDCHARAVELLFALVESVEGAAIAIALALAPGSRAGVWAILQAAVGGERVGDSVCLPYIHLVAANTVVLQVSLEK